jgi:hypothetical protein
MSGWAVELSLEGQKWDQKMEVLLLGSNHFHKWSLRLPQWWVSCEGKKTLSLFHSIASAAMAVKLSAAHEIRLYTTEHS